MNKANIIPIIISISLLTGCGSAQIPDKSHEAGLSADTSLGEWQQPVYQGMVNGIQHTLTIRHRKHSGDGTFSLEPTNQASGTQRFSGIRLTQRGTPADNDATVWQFIADNEKTIFNFLVESDSVLILLDDRFEPASPPSAFRRSSQNPAN